MPGKGTSKRHPHGKSILKNDTYEALRERGMPKGKAAAIANAQATGTINQPKKRKGKK